MKLKDRIVNDCGSKKIRQGDKVSVISGSCRGQNGTVIKVNVNSVVVQGLNLKKKHVKRSEANPKGGIMEIEAPIHISNVAVCDENGKPVKLKTEVDQNGDRKLCYMKDNQSILYRSMKSPK